MNISSVTGSSTNAISGRLICLRRMTSPATTQAAQVSEMNSYMLPQGARSVAIPRVTIDAMCAMSPTNTTG